MLYLIIGFLVIVALHIVKDWLVYKHRGRVQPDGPDSKVITGPEDATAQRQIDRTKKKDR